MGRKERKKDERRKKILQIIIGLFIISVMVLSLAQVSFQNQANTPRYNGIKFEATPEGMFQADIAGEDVLFYSVPLDGTPNNILFQSAYGLQVRVQADDASAALLKAPFTVLTFDPNTTQPDITFIELVRFDLATMAAVPSGVLHPSDVYPGSTVVTCDNQPTDYPTIQLVATNQTNGVVNITSQGACLTVTADMLALPTFRDYFFLLRSGAIIDG